VHVFPPKTLAGGMMLKSGQASMMREQLMMGYEKFLSPLSLP